MRIAPRIVSVLLATMIWRQLPLSGLWLVGTLVGVQPAFAGMIALTGGAPRAS